MPFASRLVLGTAFLVGCSGGSSSSRGATESATASSMPVQTAAASTSPSVAPSASTVATPPAADARLQFAAGFYGSTIANVGGAREIAALPNGDLLIGTSGSTIVIVPAADGAGVADAPSTFVTLSEGPAEGITYAPNGSVYAATNTTIWRIAYASGDQSEPSSKVSAIARVRTGPVAPNSDGDVHSSTSVVATATTLYAGVGSSCNACVEVDPTRATVQRMNLDGSGMTTLATRARNAIALAINPATQSLWIGGAGQDDLPYGHPYEYVDSPTLHGNANVDYGWPECEENHVAYNALGLSPAPSCVNTIAPAIEFPAYSTLIGAAFYPTNQNGPYAFPASYAGGIFVTAHGSWHCCPATPPGVYFVPMSGDAPAIPVNWSTPDVQSRAFVTGYGSQASTSYIGRPTGVAVGPNGSLFVADDQTGDIIRIRYR